MNALPFSRDSGCASSSWGERLQPLALAVTLAASCGLGLIPLGSAPLVAQTESGLLTAARLGDLAEVRRLVAGGADLNAGNRYRRTPLSHAASNGHLEIVRFLLERGADPNITDSFHGMSPLGLALDAGHLDVAFALLEGGAEQRVLALGHALRRGSVELARAAAERGPMLESELETLRRMGARAREELRTVLDEIPSRPDPPPPDYAPEELAAFAGRFEGWDSGLEVEVAVQSEGLSLTVDGKSHSLTTVGEMRFSSGDGSLQAAFFGRSGTIEGLQLRRAGAPPAALRRSVVEVVSSASAEDLAAAAPSTAPTLHWPGFRGENAAGIGDGRDTLIEWSLESGEGVLWRATLPGLGNSSPVVWGDRVYVTTAVAAEGEQKIRTGLTGAGEGVDEAVEHSWRVLAFDKWSGEQLWSTEVGRGVPLTRRHFKATQANSTPVTDGERVAVVFPTAGFAALDRGGELLWKHELGGLNAGSFSDPGLEWGFSSSPILYRDTVILQVDVHEGPYVAAWKLATGERVWRSERGDIAPSWATPSLLRTDKGDELICNGNTIRAYDPATGETLWSLGPNSELAISTPVIGEDVAYVSAGYPPIKPIYALRPGLRGDIEVEPGKPDQPLLWSHGRGGAYMPTPLLYRGIYYVVHHNGRIVAYDAANGAALYKARFSRSGTFTNSPVAVNGRIYTGTEEGLMYVIAAGPEYRELAINDFDQPLMATPAVSEGLLLVRTPSQLLAIGEPAAVTED